jgi:hypothetical protein
MNIMPPKNEKLVKFLNNLLKPAQANPVHKRFSKNEKYYNGMGAPTVGYSNNTDPIKGNNRNYYNVIRPIIETKATIALDIQVTTSVKPSSLSHANFDYIKELDSISEMLNDVWDNVKRENNVSDMHQQIVRDGLVYGIGIGEASWDSSADNGLGNVSLKRINPMNFFPEPEATTVKNANYIFVREYVSKFDLINQYQGNKRIMDILDNLNKKGVDGFEEGEETNILQGYENDKDAGQAYLRRGSVFPSSTQENFVIYKCYLKDDTIFQPIKSDNSSDEQVKKEEIFKYPNGRLIVYCGDYVLEDRPIDYPFGFPFSTYTPSSTNTLVGHSDVSDLCSTQDKLTNAYYKLNELIAKYRSMLIVSPDSINPNDLSKNFDIIASKRGQIQPPVLVSNKLVQDIQIMRSHINDLKKDALSLARINEVMLSGERPVGANSGQMIRDLNESPMSSIREMQRNFKSFLIDISNKGITLIQLYYTQPRIMRLSGQRFAVMNQDSQMIDIVNEQQNIEQQVPQNLLNDLSLTQFELEVQTGSAIPQSPMAIAQTTLQLANQGIFGDINNVDVKELILKSLDYPNYRAIIEKIKQEEAKMGQQPNEPEFSDYLKNVSLTLKDILGLIQNLSPNVQSQALYSISDSLGLTTGNPDLQEELPQGNFNVEFGNNFAQQLQSDPLEDAYASTKSLNESL